MNDPIKEFITVTSKGSKSVVYSNLIQNTVNLIHRIMFMFRIGNSFELLHSKKVLCQTLYSRKISEDMKCVTYSTEVFMPFKLDFKALVSALNKLGDCDGFKERRLDSKFLFSVLFPSNVNVNFFLAKSLKRYKYQVI